MKLVNGLGPALLLVLLPLGFLAPHAAALGPSSASLSPGDQDVQALDGSSLVTVGATADADAGTNGSSLGVPALQVGPRPGDAQAQGHATTMGAGAPVALAAATGAALGLGLLAFLVLPFFSRIDSHRILDNGQRHRVHEAIDQNPGITIKEVVQTLGIGWGTAVYHLKRLETERLIVSERHRQFRRYYKNGSGIAIGAKGALAELKHPTTLRLAAQVIQKPGSAQNELCLAAGISAPLASKYLGRMADADLLTRQREWKTVKYFPTPRLVQLMAAPSFFPSAPLAPVAA